MNDNINTHELGVHTGVGGGDMEFDLSVMFFPEISFRMAYFPRVAFDFE